MKKLFSILAFCLMLSSSMMAQSAQLDSAFLEGNDMLFAGNYSEALPRLLYVYEHDSRKDTRAFITTYITMCYVQSGQLKEAESILLNTIASFTTEAEQNTPAYAELLYDLGVVYYNLRNFEKALFYEEKVKKYCEDNLDFSFRYAKCLAQMGICQIQLGNNAYGRMLVDVGLRQASSFFESQSEDSPLIDNPYYSEQTSKNMYRSMAQMYTRILTNASYVYNHIGYVADAVQLLKKAIAVSERVGIEEPYCYGNLATLYFNNGKYREAADWLAKALPLATTTTGFDDIAMYLSFAKLMAGDADVADLTLRNAAVLRANQAYAFTFLSEQERSIYWENCNHNIPMQNLIYVLRGSQNHYGAIYDNQLYSKGLLLRATNDVYDRVVASGSEEMLASYRRLLQTRTAILGETDKWQIRDLQLQCDSIEKELLSVVGREDVSAAEPTWRDVQSRLADDELAIEFFQIDNVESDSMRQPLAHGYMYYAATLRKGYEYPHILRLLNNFQLDSLLSDTPYESADLYNTLWKPMDEELRGVSRVYFSPAGELNKVALEALVDDQKQTAASRWQMYRLSSTRELLAAQTPIHRSSYALFGGLDYNAGTEDIEASLERDGLRSASVTRNLEDTAFLDRAGVRYLPGSKTEVEKISQELQSGSEAVVAEIYTGLRGTEERLKAFSGRDVNVLHLATHGYFWSQAEAEARKGISDLIQNKDAGTSALLRSGILMTGANHVMRGNPLPDDIEDGILTAQELSDLDLSHMDLVVLSACQTALGEVGGEGVYGLQRGLKLAGVRSMLMTLWPVSDQATQVLMVEFYKHLLEGDSKAGALRRAQDSVRSVPRWSDPHYWAGFILLDALD